MSELRQLTADSLEKDHLKLMVHEMKLDCQDRIDSQNTWGVATFGVIGILLGLVVSPLIR